MTSMLKAPERTLNLEEIIPHYNFILVDSCVLHQDSRLSTDLYMVKQPEQLLRYTFQLQNIIHGIESLQEIINKHNHLYSTLGIKEEVKPFASHLRQVGSYIESKFQQQRSRQSKRGRPQFTRRNKRYNKLLEQRREEEFDVSEHNERVEHAINLLYQTADSAIKLSETIPIYQSTSNLPRLPTLKASVTDAGLVGSLVHYAQKEENKNNTAAILTADGDIIRIFHSHLKSLPAVKQIDLASRLAVHFKKQNGGEYTFFNFHTSYRVRIAASNTYES